jgi:CBS domain-containing protein
MSRARRFAHRDAQTHHLLPLKTGYNRPTRANSPEGQTMLARDLMTKEVVSVSPDTPINEIAQLLLKNTISGVPVVDADGKVLGMVTEGDLIARDDTAREARREWWLALLADGEALSPEFLKTIHWRLSARDVMISPVVTVGEDTDVTEIARILKEKRIKRVPVVRDRRVVGIISRADLLNAVAGNV